VIPAYNEAVRLPRYLRAVVLFFETRGEPFEVIVVDDGSADATSDHVREVAAAHREVRLVHFPSNVGKGRAVRAGMLNARGVLRLFADADGATPIQELERLESAHAAGADIAIGSRALADPGVTIEARPHRVWSGRVFNWLVARLGVHGIADTQCGFKSFRGPVADELFKALKTEGFAFDVELLLRAQRRGYRVAEVAVNWSDQPGSKVRVWSDGPRMLGQVVKLRAMLARERLTS